MSRRRYHDSWLHSQHRSSKGGMTGRLLETGIEIAEVGGTAFAWGAVHGRFGVIAPMGVSLDLIIGVLGALVGLFDLGGDAISPHIANLGVGSLASFLNRKGVQVGTTWRAGAPLTNPALPGTGIFGGEFARMHGGMPVANAGASAISDRELAAMTAHANAR